MKINTTTENILYLFWKANIPHSEWFKQLSAWAECSIERAGEILEDGVPLGDHEQAKIVMRHPDITIEALQYERLVEKEDILKQNLQFLFSFLEHGEMKELAVEIGVKPLTIYRWSSGDQKPSKSHQVLLCKKFGIYVGTDLQRDAVFLQPLIVGQHRKKWLKEQIDKLPPELLDQLFPSLERILKDI